MQDKSPSRRSVPLDENGTAFLMPATAFALWAPALAGAARANGEIYEGLAALGSEWLDFVNRRLKEDLKLPPQLCACRSVDEMRDTYVAFWQRAADDYQKELTAMTRLGSRLANNSMTAAQNRIEGAAREMSRPFADAA